MQAWRGVMRDMGRSSRPRFAQRPVVRFAGFAHASHCKAAYDASRRPTVLTHVRKRDALVERDPGAGVFVGAAAGFVLMGPATGPTPSHPLPPPPFSVDAVGVLRKYLRGVDRAIMGGDLAVAAGESRPSVSPARAAVGGVAPSPAAAGRWRSVTAQRGW